MKNRGITLVELIISISLISIVIIFLFALLVEVKTSDNRIDYARDNQQNRAIIIKRVQDDFLDYGLKRMDVDSSQQKKIIIRFGFERNMSSELTITEKNITYTNVDNITEKWDLPSENYKYELHCVQYQSTFFDNNDYFTVWFRIPLVAKKDSANVIDDLEFFYLGKRFSGDSQAFPNGRIALGNYEANTCG